MPHLVYAKGLSRDSLYDYRRWEICIETHEFTKEDAEQFIKDSEKDDKFLYGHKTTIYKIHELTIEQVKIMLDNGEIPRL